ncbi:unnamed protein product [Brassica oleracea]
MGHKLVSCTWSPILMHDSLRETFSLYVSLYSILEPLWDPKRNFTSTFGLLSRYKSQRFFFCRKWDKPRDAGYYNEWFQVISLQTPTASLFSYLLLCLFGIVSFVK